MLDYLGLVTVIIAPFALAAGLLWLIERRRRGEPVPELSFLVTHHGFAPALTQFGGGDFFHSFKRGADEVSVVVYGRANTEVVIHANGKTVSVAHPAWRRSPVVFAHILRY